MTSNNKYISIDLDCLDPAFAPGVSVPSPAGIQVTDLYTLSNKPLVEELWGLIL